MKTLKESLAKENLTIAQQRLVIQYDRLYSGMPQNRLKLRNHEFYHKLDEHDLLKYIPDRINTTIFINR